MVKLHPQATLVYIISDKTLGIAWENIGGIHIFIPRFAFNDSMLAEMEIYKDEVKFWGEVAVFKTYNDVDIIEVGEFMSFEMRCNMVGRVLLCNGETPYSIDDLIRLAGVEVY